MIKEFLWDLAWLKEKLVRWEIKADWLGAVEEVPNILGRGEVFMAGRAVSVVSCLPVPGPACC